MPLRRLLGFLTVVLGLTGAVHGYLWARLVGQAALPAPWHGLATGALVVLALVMPLGMVLSLVLPRALVRPFQAVAYVWMGMMFFLLVLLLPTDVARAAAWALTRLTGADEPSPEQRLALARLWAGGVGLGALGLTAAALHGGLRAARLRRVRVPLARLPAGLEGFTLVQLSDIHVGSPTIGRAFIEQLVARTNALSPDVVAITGDLVDGPVEELGPLVEPLRQLRARHGVYFVTGNHEYYSGADRWLEHLRTLGIRVLRNERVRLETPGGALELAGVDDFTAHHFGRGHGADLPRALDGRDPEVPLVLLAHQPKQAPEAAALGVDLQLSGHTHAGQLFPFSLLVRLDTPYVRGLHRVGAMQLYVSSGTGYWGPPMRLGTVAEVTRLELVRG